MSRQISSILMTIVLASAFAPAQDANKSASPDDRSAGESNAAPATTSKTVKTNSPYGTANYLPLWTGASTVGNSVVYQSGSEVGIGTTTPAATLDVNGTINAATEFKLGGNPFAWGSYASANVFLGFAGNAATTANNNTAVGYQALASDITATENTAIGAYALQNNTTGHINTATGQLALWDNTTGYLNTADGVSALQNNTTGSYNTADGASALQQNNGSYNTASGVEALQGNNSGSYNTAAGALSLTNNNTGSNNTAVGYNALSSNSSGSNLTCIGYECTTAADGLTNASAVGAHAVVGQSNSVILGGTGEWAVNVGIGTTTPSNILTIGRGLGHPVSDSWETYSSRRWKTNIQTLNGALGKIEQLRGVSYDLKGSGKHEIGVIAEEVGTVVPEIVTFEKDGSDAQGVDYGRLTALLIEAVKEQQGLIQKQQEQIGLEEARVANLTRQVHEVRTALSSSTKSNRHVRAIKATVADNQ